jgi:hypothetical protein
MSGKSAEISILKIAIIRKGLTMETLARGCGVNYSTFRTELSKNMPSKRLRIVIEHVLKTPIWSGSDDFNRRQKLIEHCGFDAYQMSADQLYQYLTVLKIRGRSKGGRRRAALIALLEQTFADKPSNQTNKISTS